MSEKRLRDLIERTSKHAGLKFARHGEVPPLMLAENANGELVTYQPFNMDKDDFSILIRARFALDHIVRYVFVFEAWRLDDALIDNYSGGSFADVPGRTEEVSFSCEDHICGILTACRAIIRRAKGKPRLGPLIYLTDQHGPVLRASGRFIGLLPARGTMQ